MQRPTDTYQLARDLAARLAIEAPDLAPLASKIARRINPCRHGPGFACVLWFGTQYHFTRTQAPAVAMLWTAWENGTPDVLHEDLVHEATGKVGKRLVDLFADNPAWGTMIVPGKLKGSYRLAEPEGKAATA